MATFLGTPSSANLAAAITDETGSGAAVFATSPTLVTPALGTPASGVLTNTTGYVWNNLANPSGALGLTMGSNTSIFNTTTALAQMFAWKNTTAAVVGTSQGSPVISTCGTAFHGSASVEDCMTISELPGNGNDATITQTIGHTGTSTGPVVTAFPGSIGVGTSPPACTAGTAGSLCFTEGTAFTNVSGTAGIYPDSTAHEFLAKTNGASGAGVMIRSQPSPISLTAQTAAITTATLCAASAGACNVAGFYRATFYLASTVVCATPGPGAVALSITFTDEIGTKTAQAVPLDVTGATSLAGTMGLGTTTANATATTSFWSTGANAVQYATTFTACTVGVGTYSIRSAVERLF